MMAHEAELGTLLNANVREIQISGIRKFSTLASRYPDAVSLTIGQPDFPTPAHVKEAGMRAIQENHTTYTPNAGLPALRAAASRFVADKYGLHYNPDDEVIVTNGASEAIDITLRTLLSEGDEVILPGPVYPGYEPIVRLCGAKPVFVDTRKNQFRLTAALIAEHLTPRTRCLILPYPSNPTGSVLGLQDLAEIAALLRDKQVFVLSDEIYSELVYVNPGDGDGDGELASGNVGGVGGRHASIASLPGMRDRTIVINGLSKSHSMTGWRIGFTFAPAYISQQMLKVHQYNATCASSVSQYAAIEALTAGANDAAPMREEYQKRRDYCYQRLQAMGLDVVLPNGAFYLFPSIAPYGLSSFEFAAQLLEQERLALVPGSAFSDFGEGHLRLSYAYKLPVLVEGLNRLERFLGSAYLRDAADRLRG